MRMNFRTMVLSLLGNGVRVSVTAGLLLASIDCERTCSPPARTMYSCEAITGIATGCVGGPPSGSSAGAPPVDPDSVFPIGCVAQMPYCVPAYLSEVQTCTCSDLGSGDGGALASWQCPR